MFFNIQTGETFGKAKEKFAYFPKIMKYKCWLVLVFWQRYYIDIHGKSYINGIHGLSVIIKELRNRYYR